MQSDYPYVNWEQFLQKTVFDYQPTGFKKEVVKIYPYNHQYLSKLNDVLKQVGNRTLANYHIWTILLKRVKYISTVKGIKETHDDPHIRNSICMDLLSDFMKLAVANVFRTWFIAQNILPQQSLKGVFSMISAIQNEFKALLETNSWLDKETREKLVSKVTIFLAMNWVLTLIVDLENEIQCSVPRKIE